MIDNFKEWLEKNKFTIVELVAHNGGSFDVSGWGCLSHSPDWPVRIGLEQDEAFRLQFISGCFNGFQISIGDSFNVYDYFYDEVFSQFMELHKFEFVEGDFDRCEHDWQETENPRTGVFVYCDKCKSGYPKGRKDMMIIKPEMKSGWRKIKQTDKKDLQSNIN